MEKEHRLIRKDQTKMSVHLKVGRWRQWGDDWRDWSWIGLARSRDLQTVLGRTHSLSRCARAGNSTCETPKALCSVPIHRLCAEICLGMTDQRMWSPMKGKEGWTCRYCISAFSSCKKLKGADDKILQIKIWLCHCSSKYSRMNQSLPGLDLLRAS